MRMNPWPPLPLESWEPTKRALHLRTQIVGKVRLAMSPPMNHWWHAALYVSARGLTTGPMPYDSGTFELEFDLIAHDLVLRTSSGGIERMSLRDEPISSFFRRLMDALRNQGIDCTIRPVPFDIQGAEPFEHDQGHDAYDADFVRSFHRVLVQVDQVFKTFRGRFVGKCSPVHFFWHSFDLAVTRFSGRRGPEREDADSVTRDAYSHEVISAGFWPGDATTQSAAFYTYAWPEPAGLSERRLQPDGAYWQEGPTGSLALLKYDDMRSMASPRAALLEFLQSAYEAAAHLADWDRSALERAEPLLAQHSTT